MSVGRRQPTGPDPSPVAPAPGTVGTANLRSSIRAAEISIAVAAGIGAVIWVLFCVTLVMTSMFLLGPLQDSGVGLANTNCLASLPSYCCVATPKLPEGIGGVKGSRGKIEACRDINLVFMLSTHAVVPSKGIWLAVRQRLPLKVEILSDFYYLLANSVVII